MKALEYNSHPRTNPGPRAWLLNLDAELELRKPQRYHPTRATLAACRSFEQQARALLAPGDVVVDRGSIKDSLTAKGYQGVAWCPTPSALAFLERAGAFPPAAPPLSCLQQVNNRRFHASLGQVLPDARFVASSEEARELLSRPTTSGWMVKRGFGFAGRGNRRFPPNPTADDWRWLEHALVDGGVQIEPWFQILLEVSLHGYLSTNGELQLGIPCTRNGADSYCYVRAQDASSLPPDETTALREQVARVGQALHGAGYFGPFGIDAFRYRSGSGVAFNARSEINARYTLAYAVGMGHPAG